jgi:hypothetical protein
VAFTTSLPIAYWTTSTPNQYLSVSELNFFSSAKQATSQMHIALGENEMIIQQINAAILITAVIVHFTTTAPAVADPEEWIKQSESNLQLVIGNMIDDFRAFGICGEQARMLAEQTADFGTSGIMTTIAAVGIGPIVMNVVATTTGPCPRTA